MPPQDVEMDLIEVALKRLSNAHIETVFGAHDARRWILTDFAMRFVEVCAPTNDDPSSMEYCPVDCRSQTLGNAKKLLNIKD